MQKQINTKKKHNTKNARAKLKTQQNKKCKSKIKNATKPKTEFTVVFWFCHCTFGLLICFALKGHHKYRLIKILSAFPGENLRVTITGNRFG